MYEKTAFKHYSFIFFIYFFLFLAIFTYSQFKLTKLENSPSGSSSRTFTYIDLSQMLKYTLINILKK